MKNNTTMLYSIISLLVGILITNLYLGTTTRIGMSGVRTLQSNAQGGMMMHQMSDGTMMGGATGMDMSSMMISMMSGLNGKTGDAFDKAFLSEMVVHHQGAVVMAEAVLKNSKRPELIKLANDIIKAQTGEISMMRSWQKTWFGIGN